MIRIINGLTYIPNFISGPMQNVLMNEIDSQEWSTELSRRTQHYGYKYDYRKKSIDSSMKAPIMPEFCYYLADHLVNKGIFLRRPDQLIINEYLPGQGIAPHIDCVPCFGETIVSISLGDSYIMDFSRYNENKFLTLEVGSLLSLNGEARYKWYHGIKPALKDGNKLRGRRISLTYRNVILNES